MFTSGPKDRFCRSFRPIRAKWSWSEGHVDRRDVPHMHGPGVAFRGAHTGIRLDTSFAHREVRETGSSLPSPLIPMRFRPILLMLSGVVVASSACSMDATAPTSQMAPVTEANAAKGKPGETFLAPRPDPFSSSTGVSYTVTINPQMTNVLRFGAHTLIIPGHAICAAGSGYGTDVFDEDCRTERKPVTITALVRGTADSIPRIDFMPRLRFSPRESVTLRLHVPGLTPGSPIGNILYC